MDIESTLTDKIGIWASYIIKAFLVGALIQGFFSEDWSGVFIRALVVFLVFLPNILGKNLKIHLPTELEFVTTLFIYSALFLGEIEKFYLRFWWWDLLLHGIAGLIFGFIGFLILFNLQKSKKITASPSLISFFSFSFSVAIGVLWEILEFSLDNFFGLNMQKSGLVDTMTDLIVDSLGAGLIAAIGYLYMVRGNEIIARLVKRILDKNKKI